MSDTTPRRETSLLSRALPRQLLLMLRRQNQLEYRRIQAEDLWQHAGGEAGGQFPNTIGLLFSVIQIALSVGLILLVLMHSGKDAGLSGAFGVGTGQGSLGGGSLVERNLNRWTIGFSIAFTVNTIILLKAPFW